MNMKREREKKENETITFQVICHYFMIMQVPVGCVRNECEHQPDLACGKDNIDKFACHKLRAK